LGYAPTSIDAHPHLDVGPMIIALRFQPSDFEYAQGGFAMFQAAIDFSSTYTHE
jgi:hypothetical protein